MPFPENLASVIIYRGFISLKYYYLRNTTMIVLDKSIGVNNVIFSPLPNEEVTLKVHSHFTKKTFYRTLSENISHSPRRYSEFEIPLTAFSSFEDGLYIYEVNSESDNLLTGILRIVSPVDSELIALATAEEDDDFVVYQSTLSHE